MYLTAHHVKAPDGSLGVNAYLHRHGKAETAAINWNSPDVTRIADHIPGRTAVQSIEISPGGNSVLSYLDLVTSEEADPRFIADWLRLFEHYVREGTFPALFASRGIAMRFGITIGLQKLAVAEYRRLRARVLQLMGITAESKVHQLIPRPSPPIRVFVSRDGLDEIYQLSRESVARVVAVRPELSLGHRVRIAADTKSDFETMIGEFYPNIATTLTGLSYAQLAQIGGVQIVEGSQTLWEMAPAGNLPGQIFGVWKSLTDPLPRPEHVPTGAVLPRLGEKLDDQSLALDLVQVQDVWLPLSEAGVYTYRHSTGLIGGEKWSFVTRPPDGSLPLVFDADFSGETLTSGEVHALYGPAGAERARTDYKTMQLRLRRRS
jgi:hypothetical protein